MTNGSLTETKMLYSALKVSRSGFYHWLTKPAQIITEQELHLYRTAKRLFKRSRGSLGSRQMVKSLNNEGFAVGRYRKRSLMRQLKSVVAQCQAYKVTTKRKHSDSVADNILAQQFNPPLPNQVCAGDVTYLRTNEGWMYLAIVMDLYSRHIIGWSISKRTTVKLVERALSMAVTLRRPSSRLLFQSDRGAQDTSLRFRNLLEIT
jgi:putative transposase